MSSGKGKDEAKPNDGTVEMGQTPASTGAGDALLGTQIDGRFTLRLVLGEGGMGKVYLAEDGKLNNRRVALKLMSPRLTADKEFRARFEREAFLQANLPHPQIVQIQDTGECADGAYIVMEYSDGRSLSRLIRELGPRPLDKALGATEQILEVLDFAHGQGVIHRDLKPSNILIEERPGREVVRLLDFGIAKLLGDAGESTKEALTRTGFAYGTMGYMAPEQARGESDKIDHRADLYSVGIMLYEMLTGDIPAPPESRSHPVRYAMWCQENSVSPLAESHPDLGLADQVDLVLKRALRRDPAERYASALAFLSDIREFREQASARTVARRTVPATTREKAKPPSQPHKRSLLGVGGWVLSTVLLLALGYGYTLWQDAEDRAGGTDTAALDTARREKADAERKAGTFEKERDELRGEKEGWIKERGELGKARDDAESQRAAAIAAAKTADGERALAEKDALAKQTVIDEKQKDIDAKQKDIDAKQKVIDEKNARIAELDKIIAAGGDTAALRQQLKTEQEATATLEKEKERLQAELASRPTAQALADAVAAQRRAERAETQAQSALSAATTARSQDVQAMIRAQNALDALKDWIRGLDTRIKAAVPANRWPPPGLEELDAARPQAGRTILVANATSTQVELTRVEAVVAGGGTKVLFTKIEVIPVNGNWTVPGVVPPEATSVTVRYNAGYRRNARDYRRKRLSMKVDLKAGETRVDLDGR